MPIISKKCEICGKKFLGKRWYIKKRRFCSISCQVKWVWKIGRIPPMKGKTAWNKGLKGYGIGDKSGMWKGDDVSYSGLHHWIRAHKGKPKICEHCGATAKERKLHWANKDHKYKRNLEDWISLCVRCHKIYDLTRGLENEKIKQ